MKQSYHIGGHHFTVTGEALCNALAGQKSFRPFAVGACMEGTPLFVCSHGGEPVPDWEKVIYRLDDEETFHTFGRCSSGGYRLHLRHIHGEQLDVWTVRQDEFVITGDLTPQLLRFALWTAYGIAAAPSLTAMIHSSCIVCHDEAVLFLGESGTGKSTHTRLWREHIAGSHLLNDDSPVIRFEEGQVWVYGSPWSGKTPCYRTERFPLKACVRLSQAPCNAIERLSVVRAYAAIHPSLPPSFAYDALLYDAMSRLMDHLLEVVPCYHLRCLPDGAAARLSYETLFGS